MNINIVKTGFGRPCALFHGWGFDHTIWNKLVARLSHHYQFYLIDLPGFGKTTLMPAVEFHHQLMKALPKPIALAGWSIGGLHATTIALDYPEQVSHLMNITSSPQFFESHNWPGIKAQLLRRFYTNLRKNSIQTLEHFFLLQGVEINRKTFFRSSQEGLEEGFELLRTYSIRDRLNNISCPGAYLFGKLDKIVPIATYHLMKTQNPMFNYHIFDYSGHIPFLSQPNEFDTVFDQFFKE